MDFIETMLVTNGNIENFEYHLDRIKKTYNHFKWKFNKQQWLKIKDKFTYKQKPLRVRITYDQFKIKNIELFEIKKRSFKTFKVVQINKNYHFKYKNRIFFEKLHKKYPQDEFILIKNNLVTDTTISNLAFFDGKEWITPKYPLLQGTKRKELIEKNLIKEKNIHKYDLKYFQKIALINAILGFFEIDNFDIIF